MILHSNYYLHNTVSFINLYAPYDTLKLESIRTDGIIKFQVLRLQEIAVKDFKFHWQLSW